MEMLLLLDDNDDAHGPGVAFRGGEDGCAEEANKRPDDSPRACVRTCSADSWTSSAAATFECNAY